MEPTLCPVVVGRDAELTLLRDALSAAAAGAGGIVFVLGDAGVGKSRLAAEARAHALDAGMVVFAGRAVERATVAYRPLSEAFRAAFRDRDPPDDPSLRAFRPALARLLPEWGETGEASELVVAEAVTRLLALAGRARGALLVLEDLHWSDPDTLTVVEYLADHLADVPCLCVATVRRGESYATETHVRRLVERRVARALTVDRLPEAETDRMVRACLGAAEIPDEVHRFVAARAEGVPLFVEEILAGLVGAGALARTDDGWRVEGALVPTVPSGFAEAIDRRFASLSQDARGVLAAAAVLGRRFDWSLLPGTTGLPEASVIDALRAASDVQLLEVDADTAAFRFRHALSRDAVLDRLLPPEVQRYAERALTALEQARGPLHGEALALGADLAERAGLRPRAVALLLTAAREEMARGAPASALASLDRARRLAGDDPELLLEIDEAAAEAAALAGDVDRAVARAERVIAALAWGAAPLERRARLHLVLARAAVAAGRWPEASDHVREAAALTRRVADDALVARADALAAQVAIAEERLDDAEALARAAAERAEAAGVPEAACEAFEVLGRRARLFDLDASEDWFMRALAVADRHGLTLWRARALHELGTVDLQTGRRRGWLERARAAAVDAGAVATIALVDLHLCAIAQADWRGEDALEAGERCVDLSRRLGSSTLGMGLIHVASAYGMLDDERGMERVIDEAIARCGDEPDVRAGVPGRARLMLDLRRADFSGARAHLDEAIDILRAHPALGFPFRGIWALLRTVEDRDAASARAEAAEAAGGRNPFVRLAIELAEAIAAGRAGRIEDARRAVGAATALRSEPAVVWESIFFGLAGEAMLRDGWGDGARVLRESLTVFDARGLESLSSWCRAALRAGGQKVPRRGRGESEVPNDLRAAGVSSREADVLRLLVGSLSNREIGARLHLSPRTVERHVANLLLKTGAADRRELARLAEKLGLTDAG